MKKLFLSLLLLCAGAITTQAQWIRVWQGGESTRYAIADAPLVPYSAAGSTITVGSDSYATAAIDSITVIYPVTITWSGTTVDVDIPENVEGVTATVSGGDVVITNANTSSEQEFILKGSSSSGSLTYNGTYKCKFHLDGVNLTSTSGAALDIQCGKRIDLIIEDGTVNSLTDAAGGTHKAALNCQGHLEVSGGGSLTIAGKTNHALRSNEYLLLKKSVGDITITDAAADGIHCGEYFQMNGGNITISGTAADGLQVETDATSAEDLNGQFIMNGGSINLTLASVDSKGIRLDADAAAPSIVPHMQLLDGTVTVNLTTTANGSKAIASDGNLTIGSTTTSPTVGITVDAGVYVDTAGEENRATGLKADQTLTIAGGATTVSATGDKSRGVRATTLTATGGSLVVTNTGTKSQGIKLDNVFRPGEGGTVSGNFKY
ncbi:MAG: carbohydrate-binding domain-containing protein [Bacteroidaceae bacterium]|nr:carbohydrate-binding domain-containing protein [Bacteroidaceae bacterium]